MKPKDIYALAHKDFSEREALDCLNKGDKTMVSYSHCPSAVNTVNVITTSDPNTAEPTDTSVNVVSHPKPPAKKTAVFNILVDTGA